MNKPEDIPQDVWGDAEYHVTGPRPTRNDEWDTVELVARAIMAAKTEEREACATYLEARGESFYVDHDDLVGQYLCEDLADAIRKREE